MPTPDLDILLWKKIRQGDTKSFDQLFLQYADLLYNYGVKFGADEALVEDCIQEFFLYIWQKRKDIQIKSSPKFYFIRSYRRVLLKKITSQRKQYEQFAEPESYPFFVELSQESVWIKEEIAEEEKQNILRSLDNLSPRQKEAIYLRYYENFDNDEIAEIMNISKPSLYKVISAAISKLRKRL